MEEAVHRNVNWHSAFMAKPSGDPGLGHVLAMIDTPLPTVATLRKVVAPVFRRYTVIVEDSPLAVAGKAAVVTVSPLGVRLNASGPPNQFA